MGKTTVMRHVEIDMGHRVIRHAGKCRNFHGHRYRIEVTFGGLIVTSGPQQGMVMDFGFIKEVLNRAIHDQCDHAMCLGAEDPWLREQFAHQRVFEDSSKKAFVQQRVGFQMPLSFGDDRTPSWKYEMGYVDNVGTLYLVPFTPTAENLAEHWFHKVANVLAGYCATDDAFAGLAPEQQPFVEKVLVWETPNCYAEYSA